MFIVGVDVAKRSHEATVIDDAGNRIKKPFNFKNDSSGFHVLLSVLESISSNPNDFIVGMESTSHYWLALYSGLRKNHLLHIRIKTGFTYIDGTHRQKVHFIFPKYHLARIVSIQPYRFSPHRVIMEETGKE